MLHLRFIPEIPAEVMASFVPVLITVDRYSRRLLREDDAFEQHQGRRMLPRELSAKLRELRDEIDTRPWFVQLPRIEGRYELQPSHFLFL